MVACRTRSTARSRMTGPNLWLDPTYVKVRDARRIVSVAFTAAVGVTGDGLRRVPAMAVGPSAPRTTKPIPTISG
ncbi:MAG: hypothetical protein EBR45_11245 [Betaproteobacteria bacterium]|nr:hypothetical protein [Betaproteobacteria bacterium]